MTPEEWVAKLKRLVVAVRQLREAAGVKAGERVVLLVEHVHPRR